MCYICICICVSHLYISHFRVFVVSVSPAINRAHTSQVVSRCFVCMSEPRQHWSLQGDLRQLPVHSVTSPWLSVTSFTLHWSSSSPCAAEWSRSFASLFIGHHRSVTSFSLDFGQPVSPRWLSDSSVHCVPRVASPPCIHHLHVHIVCLQLLYLCVVVDLQCWPKVLVVDLLVICVATLSQTVLLCRVVSMLEQFHYIFTHL